MVEDRRVGTSPTARMGALLGGSLFKNSFFLLLTSYSGNVLGFVFWLVVAQSYPPPIVGLGVTIFSILIFLSSAATLGLPFGMIRFLPAFPDKPTLVNSMLAATSLASIVLALVFLVGLGWWAPALAPMTSGPLLAIGFVCSLWLFTLANVVDTVFVALRRAVYGTIRSTIYNVLRAPLPLLVAGTLGLFGILFAWLVGLFLSLVVGIAWLTPRVIRSYRLQLRTPGLVDGRILKYSFANQAVNLASLATASLLPLIILDSPRLVDSSASSAYFYSAFAVATVVYSVANSFTTSLFVEGSHPNSHYTRDLRHSVTISLALILAGIAGILVFGNWILRLFGGAYATAGYSALVVLGISGPLVLGMNVYTAHFRVTLRTRGLLAITLVSCVSTLVLAVILVPTAGILGAADAFLAGQALGVALFVLRDAWARVSGPARTGRLS